MVQLSRTNYCHSNTFLTTDATDPQKRKELAVKYVRDMVQDTVLAKLEELKSAIMTKIDEKRAAPKK